MAAGFGYRASWTKPDAFSSKTKPEPSKKVRAGFLLLAGISGEPGMIMRGDHLQRETALWAQAVKASGAKVE